MMFENVKTEKELDRLKKRLVGDKVARRRLLSIRKKLNFRGAAARSKTLPIPSNAEVLALYREMVKNGKAKRAPELEAILRKRKTKSNSGIVAVSLLTKPFPCPGKCLYCPSEKNMPKSYLSLEPAAARALRNDFNPYKQVVSRLKALEMNGHPLDKIEIIIAGGTWNFYKHAYRESFVSEIFRACDNFKARKKIKKGEKTLIELQRINENAKCRIVGLSVETRPDFVSPDELKDMRRLGATKVEIGVQHLDEKILEKNARGISIEKIAEATALLRSFGFKIVYHMMPNLYGSTPQKDLAMFKKLFSDPRFFPDMLKIYPCVVLKGTELYKKWKSGGYKTYNDKQLENLLISVKKIIPPFVRIIRLIRDIPAGYIMAGSKISNLRQRIAVEAKKQGWHCRCIRCREIREDEINPKDFKLKKREYAVLGGKEIFLSFENKTEDKLAAFLRLSLPTGQAGLPESFGEEIPSVLKNAAIIRELHTYGKLAPLGVGGVKGGPTPSGASQHRGMGKALVQEAERIARKTGYQKLAVISGVGVRGYYRKLGFHLKDTYMVKLIG